MIVLDTHVMLWLRLGDPRLGPAACREIDRQWQDGNVAVSAISFWEVAMLKRKKRIVFPEDMALWRREQLAQGVVELAVDGETGVRATNLPGFHGDPADRLIVASALAGHSLVTGDQRILCWRGPLKRIDAGR